MLLPDWLQEALTLVKNMVCDHEAGRLADWPIWLLDP